MAEELPTKRTCGAMVVYNKMLEADLTFRDNQRVANQGAQRYSLMAKAEQLTETVSIPVVVHIVLKDATIVTDVQVKSQIDALNRDYSKRNSDIKQVPGPFQPAVGNADIQFVLATMDPKGKATTGIERKQTNANVFTDNDDVKFDTKGGMDAWPAEKYLNIWVCKLGNGLLGYAQFPGGAANTDGVVILHSAFGTTGSAAAPFNLGRTSTHEIGHWLNLRHIWGDKTDCTGDDFVADTPVQKQENTGKPNHPHVTCNNGPNGDMFMNYMDYVDDDTMVMFTHGQVDRMRSALMTSRKGFLPSGSTVA